MQYTLQPDEKVLLCKRLGEDYRRKILDETFFKKAIKSMSITNGFKPKIFASNKALTLFFNHICDIAGESAGSWQSTRYGGFHRTISNPERISEYCIANYINTVVLEDLLDLSLSMSMYKHSPKELTEIGSLMNSAKYGKNKQAYKILINKVKLFNFSIFKDVNYIIPVSTKSEFNLPLKIANYVSSCLNNIPISEPVILNKVTSTKSLSTIEQKISNIHSIEINTPVDYFSNKNILIIDDNYQSGISLNIIACILRQFNTRQLYAFTVTKTLSNNGNNA